MEKSWQTQGLRQKFVEISKKGINVFMETVANLPMDEENCEKWYEIQNIKQNYAKNIGWPDIVPMGHVAIFYMTKLQQKNCR